MVYRIFVEKKKGLDNEARGLLSEAKNLLGIENLENIRLFNRYDAENIRSFADFGAYTGDTLAEACKAYPSLKRAIAFEPDAKTFIKLPSYGMKGYDAEKTYEKAKVVKDNGRKENQCNRRTESTA